MRQVPAQQGRLADYPTALAAGWPIATGVIEGTCPYLVADRMVHEARYAGGVIPARPIVTPGEPHPNDAGFFVLDKLDDACPAELRAPLSSTGP